MQEIHSLLKLTRQQYRFLLARQDSVDVFQQLKVSIIGVDCCEEVILPEAGIRVGHIFVAKRRMGALKIRRRGDVGIISKTTRIGTSKYFMPSFLFLSKQDSYSSSFCFSFSVCLLAILAKSVVE